VKDIQLSIYFNIAVKLRKIWHHTPRKGMSHTGGAGNPD